VPRRVGDVWKQCILENKIQEMQGRELLRNALAKCNDARTDVLLSMAYQLGVEGVLQFKNMLSAIVAEQFNDAADAMMNSLWARQTPGRARRHAEMMRSGTYVVYRGLL
jgi:lysozyme